jgi:predicted TIM-barrel fold metal-dependent hydrolase
MTLSHRQSLAAAGAGIAGLVAWRAWPEQGIFNPCLGPLPPELASHPLVASAWSGLDPTRVWDAHAHLLGIGDGRQPQGAGFTKVRSGLIGLLARVQRRFFLNAAGCEHGPVDANYVARLLALAAAMPPGHKLLLLALDGRYDGEGRRDEEHTHAWTSNEYCQAVAAGNPDRLEWAASVHPYRPDAIAAIEKARAGGARALKWIPSAQGIDPASQRCDEVYRQLARLDLPLIVHAGEERAAPGDDELGNPLRLRRALEQGVRVVVAHCASMGRCRDLDAGGHGSSIDCFSLFERMMAEAAHVGRLFGDISALTQRARAGRPLRRVLERGADGGAWVGRLLNGSDYPIPALMPLYSLGRLARDGLLDAAAIAPLTAIRRHNSLLFDFALKRHLRLNGRGLASSVFETRDFFESGLAVK